MIGVLAVFACIAPMPLTAAYIPDPGRGHAVSGPTGKESPTGVDTFETWYSTSWDKDTYVWDDPPEVRVRWLWSVYEAYNASFPSIGELQENQPGMVSEDTSTGERVFGWLYKLEQIPDGEHRIRYFRIRWHDLVDDMDPTEKASVGGIDEDSTLFKTVVLTGRNGPGE